MKVKDPVCGMTIEQRDAQAQSTHGGTTYYFCSEECRREFDANPDRYTAQGAGAKA